MPPRAPPRRPRPSRKTVRRETPSSANVFANESNRASKLPILSPTNAASSHGMAQLNGRQCVVSPDGLARGSFLLTARARRLKVHSLRLRSAAAPSPLFIGEPLRLCDSLKLLFESFPCFDSQPSQAFACLNRLATTLPASISPEGPSQVTRAARNRKACPHSRANPRRAPTGRENTPSYYPRGCCTSIACLSS